MNISKKKLKYKNILKALKLSNANILDERFRKTNRVAIIFIIFFTTKVTIIDISFKPINLKKSFIIILIRKITIPTKTKTT